MSGQLIFDESTMINGNIFKFEDRLHSHMNKYIEKGSIFSIYFSQDENSSTVDRGLQNIDELFGKHAPLRYNKIMNFPLYSFGQVNPENTDEQQIEDINVNGECIILPSTIVPKVNDLFIIKHLKMNALFIVSNVQYDSMKVDGYYKINYRLQTTSEERIQQLMNKIINTYHTDLNAVGSNVNPIIKEDKFILKKKIQQMLNQMISSYRALFYNERHNCFLFHHPETGLDWFDMCGNEFMAKYSLMNYFNSSNVIVLHDKIKDSQMPLIYNRSIYNWLEMDAPLRLLQKFPFILTSAEGYPYSSFVRWGDVDIQIINPIDVNQVTANSVLDQYYYFNNTQFNTFMNSNIEPYNEYEKLIWKFIHYTNISIEDISLYTGDVLINSVNHIYVYLYTPIIIFIIRKILEMN